MVARRVVFILALGGFFCLAAASLASTLPAGNRSNAVLSGTYGFNFQGTNLFFNPARPVVGSGSITFDGLGNVVAGVIYCHIYVGGESEGDIVGGRYSLRTDGTGFVTINLSTSAGIDQVCGLIDGPPSGIDLRVAIVSTGTNGVGYLIRFSSDASNNFHTNGQNLPIAGEMQLIH